MKTVYTVHGSEDGILGVYSSLKKATVRAADYCRIDVEEAQEQMRAEGKGYTYFIEGENAADIEKFFVE